MRSKIISKSIGVLLVLVSLLIGTVYANEVGTVTDIDGNVYETVKIGNQWWMVENLKVTHYRNGEAIPHVTDGSSWPGLVTGAYCEYDNDVDNVATYGRLYNWYAVDDPSNIAPEGWHVPTDAEWQTLADNLGGSSVAGGKLKEAGTTHWASPNTGATNESGFTALPGGYRGTEFGYGSFSTIGTSEYFWSSTESDSGNAWNRHLSSVSEQLHRDDSDWPNGFAVRCVRGCCLAPTVGDMNQSGVVDITDIQVVVDNQFLTLTPLVCQDEGDIDFSGVVDITDLQLLIDNQFITLTPLPPCP